MQKIIIVTGHWNSNGNWKDTCENVNELLSEGWKFVSQAPMGAYGFGYTSGDDTSYSNPAYSDSGFATLIVLEKS